MKTKVIVGTRKYDLKNINISKQDVILLHLKDCFLKGGGYYKKADGQQLEELINRIKVCALLNISVKACKGVQQQTRSLKHSIAINDSH